MKKLIYIFIILSVIASSCTEKIDIELEETYTRLVVEGNITTDTMAHAIRLTTTTSYYYNEVAPPVENATVTITDGDETIELTEKEPGIYMTEDDYFGQIGRTYTLDIYLEKAINELDHYSASDKIPLIGPIDSIQVEYISQWEVWSVNIFAWEPPTTEYYLFKTWVNGVLETDTANQFNVSNDLFFNGNYTNGVMVSWLDENVIKVGDTVTLEMGSITKPYTDFLWNLQDQTGYQNPLFSGPPANISTNISDGALGFFAAYSTEYSTTIVVEKATD